MPPRAEKSYIQRALDVVRALAEHPEANGVSELARRLDMSRSSVHRVLQELVSTGWVAYQPRSRSYTLGPGAVELTLFILDWLPIRHLVRPALYQLRDVTEVSCGLLLKMGNRYAPVDHVSSKKSPGFVPIMGVARALRYGAGGRAILAFQPTEYIDGYLRRLESRPESGQLYDDPAWLCGELEQIRQQAFSISQAGESGPKLNTLAFPLRGVDGAVTAALSILGSEDLWSRERMLECAPECFEIIQALEGRLRDSFPD